MWPFKKSAEEQRALERWPWDTGSPGGGPADRTLSVDRALALVPVFGAARLLADSIASLPPVLYTAGTDGVPVRQPTPSLFVQPSIHGTLVDWIHRAVVSMALWGDAVGLVTQRNYYGFPTMVEWLNPQQVATDDGTLSGAGSYMHPLWWWNGRSLNPEDLVHIPWFSMPYRIRGLSPIGAFRLTANTGIGAEEYAAAWFQNGGVPPGTFRNLKQTVSKEDADILSARLTNRMQTRRPLVYGCDWEYNPIAINPHEAQFVETARLTATQIAVIYGLPPHKLGGSTGDSMTYTSVEQDAIDFLTFSLRPWLVRLEAALTNLFPRGTFVKFDVNELLRTDAKTKAEVDALSLGYNPPGWKSIPEVRRGNDLGPIAASQLPTPYNQPPAIAPPQNNPLKPVPPSTNGVHPVNAGAN
jgi:HK97 family phage portal protein